jgi:hypothetical protein
MPYKVCPKCKKKNRITTDYCEDCKNISLSTVAIQNDPPPAATPAPPQPAAPAAPAEPALSPAPGNRAASPCHGSTRVSHGCLVHGTSGLRLPLIDGEEIGRESAGLAGRLAEYDTISRRHCRFERDPVSGALFLVDLGSTNHSWINDRRLMPNQREPLTPGDRVRLADHQFVFERS